MKPNKELPELLEAIRKNTVEAYKLLQTQNASDLSKTMAELGLQNFSISYYVAEYEFTSRSLEAEYKRQMSVSFMHEREGGATEKNADAKAKIKWADMHKEFLIANKMYRLARSTHADIENLLDIIRSRIGILRQEMSQMREN